MTETMKPKPQPDYHQLATDLPNTEAFAWLTQGQDLEFLQAQDREGEQVNTRSSHRFYALTALECLANIGSEDADDDASDDERSRAYRRSYPLWYLLYPFNDFLGPKGLKGRCLYLTTPFFGNLKLVWRRSDNAIAIIDRHKKEIVGTVGDPRTPAGREELLRFLCAWVLRRQPRLPNGLRDYSRPKMKLSEITGATALLRHTLGKHSSGRVAKKRYEKKVDSQKLGTPLRDVTSAMGELTTGDDVEDTEMEDPSTSTLDQHLITLLETDEEEEAQTVPHPEMDNSMG